MQFPGVAAKSPERTRVTQVASSSRAASSLRGRSGVNADLATGDTSEPETDLTDDQQDQASLNDLVAAIDTEPTEIDETDDDDAEEGILDEEPDDLASDEGRDDRQSYWGR
jgi:hypothetical protein